KQEIYHLAELKGFAPFVFVKDALVEEHSASRWVLIERDDYYPTVTIFVVTGNCTDAKQLKFWNKTHFSTYSSLFLKSFLHRFCVHIQSFSLR
ncbi:MAG: hypothetical protein ACE5PV_13195, partial [Candidatus Poribacteria bacterium]